MNINSGAHSVHKQADVRSCGHGKSSSSDSERSTEKKLLQTDSAAFVLATCYSGGILMLRSFLLC